MRINIGLDVINSYRRLAYTPWHALAEFVDNSTQAYFDNRDVLDAALEAEDEGLEVSIAYDRDSGVLRVSDNSIGMSLGDLNRALHVAMPPANTSGRSKYGMGLKTAACWLGNLWTIKTKKLGETEEHEVTVDVGKISEGDPDLQYRAIGGRPPEKHYTIIEIEQMNRAFHGRTLGKIRQYLSSMYREDFRNGTLTLLWKGEPLEWEEVSLLKAVDGTEYRKPFNFRVDGKDVHGWVGILEKGGRADAGFSIIHCGRVVRGWPDSWRPSSLYGQPQGSNDLVNQRLVGEIHLDGFDVSHTKDDILWLGDQEERVEEELLKHCGDYKQHAREHRKGTDDERGPTERETSVAVDELRRELESPEMVDSVVVESVPAPETLDAQTHSIVESVVTASVEPTFAASLPDMTIKGFLLSMSPNDPYVTHDSTAADEVLIIINQAHPHWKELKGSDGVLNYLRHCVYDGIAEWQAKKKTGSLSPNTVKHLKDRLLRIPFDIEMTTNGDERECLLVLDESGD